MTYDLIYLVDDFDMVNLLHRILLRQLGLEDRIRVFTNPEEALGDLNASDEEDLRILILLDINMPEMSGFEFLQQMEAGSFPHHIDVIVVTSSISDADMMLAKSYPRFVRDFVTKPLKLEKLGNIIHSADGMIKSELS